MNARKRIFFSPFCTKQTEQCERLTSVQQKRILTKMELYERVASMQQKQILTKSEQCERGLIYL